MSFMMMKHSISKAFKGIMSAEKSAKMFPEEIENCFAKNEKLETSTLLVNLQRSRKQNGTYGSMLWKCLISLQN